MINKLIICPYNTYIIPSFRLKFHWYELYHLEKCRTTCSLITCLCRQSYSCPSTSTSCVSAVPGCIADEIPDHHLWNKACNIRVSVAFFDPARPGLSWPDLTHQASSSSLQSSSSLTLFCNELRRVWLLKLSSKVFLPPWNCWPIIKNLLHGITNLKSRILSSRCRRVLL